MVLTEINSYVWSRRVEVIALLLTDINDSGSNQNTNLTNNQLSNVLVRDVFWLDP
jgi:hypothetical protein